MVSVRHLGDITKISGYDIEPVWFIMGGSPCQDLSVAGKRDGLAGSRSGLFMEQIRVIREMREADVLRGRTGEFIRCRYAGWENVPGSFSSNKGRDFQAVLTEFIRVACPDAPAVPLPDKGKWRKWGGTWDTDLTVGGVLPTGLTTLSSGAYRSEGEESAFSLITEDGQPTGYCLTLNTEEKPRIPILSKLSQILETDPDPKYRLSSKACRGILNRAARRGKELPPLLKAALEAQAEMGW